MISVAVVRGVVRGVLLHADPVTRLPVLYCFGEDTTYQVEDGKVRLEVPRLSRLGSCSEGPSVGSLDGCL